MNKLDALIDILQQQHDTYSEIYDLEKDKTNVMIAGDMVALDKIIATEQSMSMRLNNLETKRIAKQEELGYKGMTIVQIIDVADAQMAERLMVLFKDLSALLLEIKKLNNANTSLLNYRLEMLAEITQSGSQSKSDNIYTNTKSHVSNSDRSTMFKKV